MPATTGASKGPTDDPAITALRESVKRAMLATLLFSHGTPMLLGGDEFGHSQHGNNNPYCHDSELTWLDWAQAEAPAGVEQQRYVSRLLQLRRDHCTLRSAIFSTA